LYASITTMNTLLAALIVLVIPYYYHMSSRRTIPQQQGSAKVRRHYAQLGLSNRTAIEFFQGGHEINGRGTFAFLHKHLNRPAK